MPILLGAAAAVSFLDARIVCQSCSGACQLSNDVAQGNTKWIVLLLHAMPWFHDFM
jgi:hypothetical protein